MKAIVTCSLITGLGDMFSGIYWVWHRQEELKKLGYKVQVFFACPTSLYSNITSQEDCLYLTKIFDFSHFDDCTILKDLDTNIGNFPEYEKFKLVSNYVNVIRCYVEKENFLNSLSLTDFSNIFRRDDLVKKCFFTSEVKNYLDFEISKYPKNFYLIHFRHTDFHDVEEEIMRYEKYLDSFIEENRDKNFILITSAGKVKDWVISKNYKNFYFNEYKQGEDTWITNLKNDELFVYLKNTLVDMYLVSYADKILRLGVARGSAFLIYGIINNKTPHTNEERII